MQCDVLIIGGGQAAPPLTQALVEAGRSVVVAERRHLGGSCVTIDDAQAELDRLVAAYRDDAPRLADWLERNVPEGLAVMTLPIHHRRRMRTSNPIERAVQQEIKRRTVKVRVFPNREALIRLVSAVTNELRERRKIQSTGIW